MKQPKPCTALGIKLNPAIFFYRPPFLRLLEDLDLHGAGNRICVHRPLRFWAENNAMYTYIDLNQQHDKLHLGPRLRR